MSRGISNAAAPAPFSRQSLFSASSFLLLGTALSKLLGFIREVIVARFFGASASMDAFLVAQSIPTIIGSAVGSVFATAFIPIYMQIEARDGSIGTKRLSRALVIVAVGFAAILAVIVCFAAGPIITTLAPELPQDTAAAAQRMMLWLALLIVGLVLYNLLSAVYHAKSHFVIPTFSQLAENLVVIIVLVLFAQISGIDALVIGSVAGVYGIIVLLLIPLVRSGEFRYFGPIRGAGVGIIFRIGWPLLFGVVLFQISPMIERYFASGLAEGSISSLGYARRLIELPSVLLITTMTTAAFPTLSQLFSQGSFEAVAQLERRVMGHLVFVLMPVTAVLIVYARPIVSFVFERGAFDAHAVDSTSRALELYAVGLVANGCYTILTKSFYAIGDMKTPMVIAVVANIIHIGANLLLVRLLGSAGIALATTVMYLVAWAGLAYAFQRRIGSATNGSVIGFIARSGFCATASMLPVYLFLPHAGVEGVIVSVLAFGAGYFALGKILLREEIRLVGETARRLAHGAAGLVRKNAG